MPSVSRSTVMNSKKRPERAVAVGLLTQRDLDLLGDGFRRVYALREPVELSEPIDFAMLLRAIDVAASRSTPF